MEPRPDDILNDGPTVRTGEEIVRSWLRILVLMLAAAILVQAAWAEKGKEQQNKVTAYLTPGATEKEAIVAIWMSNINPVIGITLPFKFAIGEDTLRLDSADVIGSRAAEFLMTAPLYKPENATLLMNMIAKTDTVTHKMPPIPPGEGPLVTFYFRTDSKFPIDKIKMATVQLPPENVLLFVTDSYASVNPAFEFVRKAPPSAGAKSGKKI